MEERKKKKIPASLSLCNFSHFLLIPFGLINLSIFPVADVPHPGVMEVVTWRAISPHIEGVTPFSPGGFWVYFTLLFSAYLNDAVKHP